MNVPAKIPELLTKSLTQHELDEHRAKIGMFCEVTYRKHDKFGWDQMDSAIRTMIRKDWMDALAPYPLSEIDAARKEATIRNPRKVPNEGDIRALIIEARKASQPVSAFKTQNQQSWESVRETREQFDSDAIVAELANSKRVG